MEIPQIAQLALQGGASVILVMFAYKVFKFLKEEVIELLSDIKGLLEKQNNNHLEHISDNTEKSVELSEKAIKQHKNIIENQDELFNEVKE